MRLAKLGKKQSPEIVAKRVASRKGYHPTQETIDKRNATRKRNHPT